MSIFGSKLFRLIVLILILVSSDLRRTFIEEKLGSKYVEGRAVEFARSFEETSPSTPIFFILSPGVNPLKVRVT